MPNKFPPTWDALFRQMADSLPQMVWTCDAEGNHDYASPKWLAYLGASALDQTEAGWFPQVHPEDRERWRQAWHRAQAQGAELQLELRLRRYDGGYHWMETRAVPLRDEAGRIRKWFGTHTDIASPQAMRGALRQSYEQLRLLIEQAPVSIAMFDREMRYLAASQRWKADYDRAEQNIIGRSHYEVFPDLPERWKAVHQKALAGELLKQDEDEWQRADGHRMWLRWAVHPWRDAYGAIGGIIISTADITPYKQSEAELEKSLEQVRSLATHLQDVREEERKRIARELHDELGQALASLKYDLAWLERQALSAPGAKVQPLKKKIRTMSRLIDATIQIGRKIASELRPRVLDDLGLIAALRWQAHDFQTRTGIPCELVTLMEDLPLEAGRATAAFRICQEALTNVLRHAQAKAVTIRLQVENNCLRLEVQDDGRGITPHDIQRAGSLGLLGMKERVLPYGGTIDIVGQVGKGTTITVLLPLLTT